MQALAEQVKRAKSKKGRQQVTEEEREKLERQLQSMQSRVEATKRAQQQKEVLKSWKESERKRREDGKKPFYLKKGLFCLLTCIFFLYVERIETWWLTTTDHQQHKKRRWCKRRRWRS